MSERDPIPGLDALAHSGEQQAHPLAPEEVRRMGNRRRQRRHLSYVVAAAAVVVAVGGGVVLSQTVLQSNQLPDPATTPSVVSATPSSTPSPVREIGPQNLLTADDVTTAAGGQSDVVEVDPDLGRGTEAISVCFAADAYPETRVQTSAARNFRYAEQDPDYRLAGEPGFYTQALQFADAAAAEEAQQLIEGWVADCAETITQSYDLIATDWQPDWLPVEVDGQQVGAFTELPTYRNADDTSENGYFESIGITRVDDRLMLTVMLDYGNESHWAYSKDDPTGLPMHPQFGLIGSSAERLPA